jgi:hypothetical protein
MNPSSDTHSSMDNNELLSTIEPVVDLSPDAQEAICESIKLAEQRMIALFFPEDLYVSCCQFNLDDESQKLTHFYEELFEQHKELWSKAGIVFVDQQQKDKHPSSKVTIRREFSSTNKLLLLEISFSCKEMFAIFRVDNLEKKAEHARLVKQHKLSYINEAEEISSAVESILAAPEDGTPLTKELLVARLNVFYKKWPMLNGEVSFLGETLVKVSDPYHIIDFEDDPIFPMLPSGCEETDKFSWGPEVVANLEKSKPLLVTAAQSKPVVISDFHKSNRFKFFTVAALGVAAAACATAVNYYCSSTK